MGDVWRAEQAEKRAKRDLSHYIREAVDGADLSEVESIVDDIITAAVCRARSRSEFQKLVVRVLIFLLQNCTSTSNVACSQINHMVRELETFK